MDSAVTATLTPSGIPWFLPVHFNIIVTSSNFQIRTISSETNININIAPIQTTMAYNISVTPCNSFGCNEGCQQYSMILPAEGITLIIPCMHQILHVLVYCQSLCNAYPQINLNSADSNTTNSGSGVNSFNAIIGVARCGILLIVAALTSAVLAVWVIKW